MKLLIVFCLFLTVSHHLTIAQENSPDDFDDDYNVTYYSRVFSIKQLREYEDSIAESEKPKPKKEHRQLTYLEQYMELSKQCYLIYVFGMILLIGFLFVKCCDHRPQPVNNAENGSSEEHPPQWRTRTLSEEREMELLRRTERRHHRDSQSSRGRRVVT